MIERPEQPPVRLVEWLTTLAFWADPRKVRPDPQAIYVELMNGRPVPGLGSFDVRAALTALATRLPGLMPPPGETGETAWEAPDNSSMFELAWSPQHLVVTARGNYTNEQINEIINACIDFGGGRLYDPQVGKRFDAV